MIVNIEFKGDLTYAPQRCKVRIKDAIDFKIDLGLAFRIRYSVWSRAEI